MRIKTCHTLILLISFGLSPLTFAIDSPVEFNPNWYECEDKKADDSDLQPGDLVNPARSLGHGTYGALFECVFSKSKSGLDRPPHPFPRVVVKKIPGRSVLDKHGNPTREFRIVSIDDLPDDQRLDYGKEFGVAQKATGENVVKFFHFDPASGVIYGEKLDETLEQYKNRCLWRVARKRTLSLDEVLYMEQSLFGGVRSFHEAGYAHADVSTTNVMISYKNPKDKENCVPLTPSKVEYRIIDPGAAVEILAPTSKEGACAERMVFRHLTTDWFRSHYTHAPIAFKVLGKGENFGYRISYLGDMYSLGMILAGMIVGENIYPLLINEPNPSNRMDLHERPLARIEIEGWLSFKLEGLSREDKIRAKEFNSRLLLYLQADVPEMNLDLGDTTARLTNYEEFIRRLSIPSPIEDPSIMGAMEEERHSSETSSVSSLTKSGDDTE